MKDLSGRFLTRLDLKVLGADRLAQAFRTGRHLNRLNSHAFKCFGFASLTRVAGELSQFLGAPLQGVLRSANTHSKRIQ